MRLCGIETEYGLWIEGRTAGDQIEDAAALIASLPLPVFAGWDYAHESPRADLRGFQVDRLTPDPNDAQWDAGRPPGYERNFLTNRVLPNGGRLYNDHGHPEYATPECAHITDLVAYDIAGERILLSAAQAYASKTGYKVRLYKNNTDFHGASYGTHESYLVPRKVDVSQLIAHLVPFLLARVIFVGAGKVGSEVGKTCRYQLSQRLEFCHEVASVETLYRRPIFNTRDEPHASPRDWMRLHIISGDANRSQWATAMKVGTMSLALDLVEIGEAPLFALMDPVKTAQELSKDESYRWEIPLEGNSWTTAPEIMEAFRASAERFLQGRDAETDWILHEWKQALDDLAKDPMRLSDRADWAAKKAILEEAATQAGKWDESRMQALDLEYHNINPKEGLYGALAQMKRTRLLVNEARIADAMTTPPADTRAMIRGSAIARFKDKIRTVGWRRLIITANGQDHSVELPVTVCDRSIINSATSVEEWVQQVKSLENTG